MDIPKEGREKATEFYVQRLSFRPVDIVMKLGSFLQAEGDWDQHNFLMMHRSDCYGINHGRVEYVCDMTRIDESYPTPRIWEETPPHHIWLLRPPKASDEPGWTTCP
jgi:hypothetical protein